MPSSEPPKVPATSLCDGSKRSSIADVTFAIDDFSSTPFEPGEHLRAVFTDALIRILVVLSKSRSTQKENPRLIALKKKGGELHTYTTQAPSDHVKPTVAKSGCHWRRFGEFNSLESLNPALPAPVCNEIVLQPRFEFI
jgi:hypothetical protein